MADSQLASRVRATLNETLDGDMWTLSSTADGYQLTLSDRVLRFSAHDAPAETTRWVLTLVADGETVSKFGPYAATEPLVEQLRSVLESDVLYTVCCDGTPGE